MVKFFSILLFLFSLIDIIFADQTPVILKDQKGLYELGLNLDILEDLSSKLSIHDVNKKKWFDKFKKSEQKVPNFGGTSSAFWARLRIKNEANPKKEWFLSFNFYTQDEITFYKKKGLDWIGFQ